MRCFLVSLRVALCGFLICLTLAQAQTREVRDEGLPIHLNLPFGTPVSITLPHALVRYETALQPDALSIQFDQAIRTRMTIQARYRDTKGALTVFTQHDKLYQFVLDTTADASIAPVVVQAPPEPDATPPPPPQRVHHARQYGPKAPPRNEPVYLLWYAQWAFLNGSPRPPSVHCQSMQHVDVTEGQRAETLLRCDVPGFYGYTLRITNETSELRILPLELISDPRAVLITSNIDGHVPPRREGLQPGELPAGHALYLHLVYQEAL